MYCFMKKLLLIIVVSFVITIFLKSAFVSCKNNVIEWNECTEILAQLQQCSRKLHLPKNCADLKKSEIVLCAENVMKDTSLCKDKLAITMMQNILNFFKLSDKVLCETNIHKKFAEDKTCMEISRKIAGHTALILINNLSGKGCRALKSGMYVISLDVPQSKCYDLLKDYVDALFKETACGYLQIASPTFDELKDVKVVASNLVTCWIVNEERQSCDSEVSKRMKCLNAIDISGINKEFLPIAHNFIEVSKETDKAICSSKGLKKDFEDHDDCWTYVKTIGLMILEQANGLLTDEGCKAVKYRENITMANFDQHCAKLLLDYRAEIDKRLPCVAAIAFAFGTVNYCSSVIFITALIVARISSILY